MSAPESNAPPPEGEAGGDAATESPAVTDAPGVAPSGISTPEVAALPEDLRAAWSWPDLTLFFLFVLGSSIVFPLLAALAAVVWWGVKPWDIDKSPATKAAILTAGQALWSGAAVAYLYGVVRLRQRGPFWRAIGWRRLRPRTMTPKAATLLCLLGGVGLALVVQAASGLVGKPTKLPIEELFQSRQSVLWLMALGILVAPLVEETIFRGYIYPVLARSFGVPAGVLGTGVLFGLMHAPQLWGGWGQIALLMGVGVVLTYVRARTGTVLASYFFHLGYNSILFLGLYFVTGGLRHFPSGP